MYNKNREIDYTVDLTNVFPTKDIYESIVSKVKNAELWQIDAAWAVLKYRKENDRKAFGILRKVNSINGIFGFDITKYLPVETIEGDDKKFDRIIDGESRKIINTLLLEYGRKDS
jgi:hypothetical protein